MKLKILFISLLFFITSCGKSVKNPKSTIGTWDFCDRSGNYWELKITKDYVLNLSTKDTNVWLLKNKFKDSLLIWSTWKLENNIRLLGDSAFIKPIYQSRNKLILVVMRPWGFDTLRLNKKEISIENIDFSNFNSWKNKTLLEFKERAKSIDCPDLRTEKEKNIPPLDLDDIDEEEIPIITIE
jgi:hypothetical protein